jgi:hypothetical protein
MRRLIGIALVAAAAAAAARELMSRRHRVVAGGNGHSADAERVEMLRERIAAARRKLKDELDSVRGAE